MYMTSFITEQYFTLTVGIRGRMLNDFDWHNAPSSAAFALASSHDLWKIIITKYGSIQYLNSKD